MIKSAKFRTIREAHEWLLHEIIWNHETVITEDGEITWEYPTPVSLTVEFPFKDMIHPNSSFKAKLCEEYATQLLSGTINQFDYTYHDRLFEYGSVNQMSALIEHLKTNPQTRRALAITWNPVLDSYRSGCNRSVPCLQYIQFIIRKNKLNMISLFRSEDILQAFGPNVFGLVHLMRFVSDETGVNAGTYTHIVTVPHLYPVRDKAELNRWM